MTGRPGEARELFEALLDTVGPIGLMPEQWDPVNERSMGNYPQAYSHLGVIRCARLFDALGGRRTTACAVGTDGAGRKDV